MFADFKRRENGPKFQVKIACNIPNMNDGTSLYRAMGPLGHLRRFANVSTHHLGTWSLSTLMEVDILFMQRPYTDDHREILTMAKDIGVPVWVDYDDLLIMLPTDNPLYFNYMRSDKLANMKFIIESADIITVSTKALAKSIETMNKNIRVIPNAFDMRYRIFAERPKIMPKRQKAVTWRGSRTHHRDVFTVCQTLFGAQKNHPEWVWHFFGDNLWLLTDNMIHEKTVVHPTKDWPAFLKNLFNVHPTIMVSPLHDHQFNHCKSNIAWMEAAFAGAVTVAPAFDEWMRPGCLTYNSEREMASLLDRVLRGEVDTVTMAGQAWEYIQENLTLDRVNELRADVIQSLL